MPPKKPTARASRSTPGRATPPAKTPPDAAPAGYGDLLAQIKERIRTAQLKASLAVNRGMIELY